MRGYFYTHSVLEDIFIHILCERIFLYTFYKRRVTLLDSLVILILLFRSRVWGWGVGVGGGFEGRRVLKLFFIFDTFVAKLVVTTKQV